MFLLKRNGSFQNIIYRKKQEVQQKKRNNIMNYRISKKIYKRADFKLKSFIATNHDKRTTYDIAKEENILSGLESSIFISKQNKWMKRLNNIVDELKEEGEW